MELFQSLVWTFAIALTATFVVALIARLGGAKPAWPLMLGISVGVTAAQAINTLFAVPLNWHPFVAGATVGTCVLLTQLLAGNIRRKP